MQGCIQIFKARKIYQSRRGKVFRQIGVLDALQPKDMVSFTIDKTVPGFIRGVRFFYRSRRNELS